MGLTEFSKFAAIHPTDACEALDNWTVELHSQADERGGWYSAPHGYRVVGLADCNNRVITIGTDQLGESALFHEFGHTLDSCLTPQHERWEDRGFEKAIKYAGAVYGRVD